MLTSFQAIILGLLQGVSELFPVSSLGHSVILPALLNWNIDQSSDQFLAFLVALHLATALVLIGYFWKDWLLVIQGLLRSIYMRSIRHDDVYAKLGWLLVVGTIPAGLAGLLLEHKIQALFAAPIFAAIFLALNGVMLLLIERFSKNHRHLAVEQVPEGSDGRISRLGWKHALGVGVAQCLALIPGLSRTGSTLGGGLLSGLSHEDAARFSFLLAAPIILAAAVLKLPELRYAGGWLMPIALGALAAALAAYFSVRFLVKYFKSHSLTPFAIYCMVAGILSFVILVMR